MATAHLIHGYLGAGKTTFAKTLERDLPAMRFSHDEWMTALFGDNPPVETFRQQTDAVYALINRHWPRALELGLDVVLDNGFWSRSDRDEARAAIAAVGGTCKLYHLTCHENIAWERVQKRNLDLNGSFFIERNTFDVLKERFEPLGPDEEHVEICPSAG